MIIEQEAIQHLIKNFPQIREEIESFESLLHLQFSCFARYTQLQIDNQNKAELKRCFECVRMLLKDGNHEVHNASIVSYLAHLDFKDGKKQRNWALNEMPALLKQELKMYDQYFSSLFE